jgi:hypothetical protein
VAQVEQVSEQVAAARQFATTTSAEVEQVRHLLGRQGFGVTDTISGIISSIQTRARRGES